jgi:hypothetical protein
MIQCNDRKIEFSCNQCSNNRSFIVCMIFTNVNQKTCDNCIYQHRVFECFFNKYVFVTNFDSIIQQHNISITFDNRIDTRVHDDAIDNLSSYFFVRINRRKFEILSISAIQFSSSSQSMFAITSIATTIQTMFDQSSKKNQNFFMNDENDFVFSSSISSSFFEIANENFLSTNENEISKSNQSTQSSIVTKNFENIFVRAKIRFSRRFFDFD